MSSIYKLGDSVSSVKGVGEKKRERLEQIGICTVEDLLNHIPSRYLNKCSVTDSEHFIDGDEVLAAGTLVFKRLKRLSYGRTVLELKMSDVSGVFFISFFNSSYLASKLHAGEKYAVFGRVRFRNGLKLFTNPSICEEGGDKDLRGFVPVYRCTKGITVNDFIKWERAAVANTAIDDWLSEELRTKRKLCGLRDAYRNIHFPAGNDWYRVSLYRLLYDRLLTYQIALRENSSMLSSADVDASVPDIDMKPFINSLQFELTQGQQSALDDIIGDLSERRPMNRLIQGDVGCGKTVVAEAAIYKAVKGGGQAAFMAPTEILTHQHYDKLSRDLEPFGIRTAMLVSGVKASERKELLSGLKLGRIDLIVGTHALIQNDVEFENLSLVITDEQHRFGVNQRKALLGKGGMANVLVMSATPIPRTLAATVFGDMDFSVIRSMPADRLEIITRQYSRESRELAYRLVSVELSHGNQAYIVAPSIEDDEGELASAESLYGEMKKKYRGHKVGLIHGRLDKAEKENIMRDFLAHRIDVLVSTVVIEVGIDVPGATVIVIENSERFGLAQLHQLRGRVGRSDKQSYCCLICCSSSDAAAERMDAMVEMSSGFDISEADYRMRGAGDLGGTMQHGISENGILGLSKYTAILEAAADDASEIIDNPRLVDGDELARRLASAEVTDNSYVI